MRYRECGLAGLQNRRRSDSDLSRYFSRHPKAAILAAYWSLAWFQSPRSIHRAIVRNSGRLAVCQICSYETVRLWLKRELRPVLAGLALLGQIAFRELAFEEARLGLLEMRRRRS